IHRQIGLLRIGVAPCPRNLFPTRSGRADLVRRLQSDGNHGSRNADARHDAHPIDERWRRQNFRQSGPLARSPAPRKERGQGCRSHPRTARQCRIHPRLHHSETGLRTLEQRRTAPPWSENAGFRSCGNHYDDLVDAASWIEVNLMRRTYLSAFSCIGILFFLAQTARAQQQHTITTVAGGGVPNNVPALQVGVSHPTGAFKDSVGNLFVSSGHLGSAVYKIDPSGQLTTIAGSGAGGLSGDGGRAPSAALQDPGGVSVDRFGNIFIAETLNDRIREIVAATGNIRTVAGNGTYGFSGDGGPATDAELDTPNGVFVDTSGNIFIADTGNSRIREVVAATGIIQTVAGNGTFGFSGDGGLATGAALYDPDGVYVDGSGNIFIADFWNNRMREVVATTGNIQTVAPAAVPYGVFVDNSGNIVIAATYSNQVFELLAATGATQAVAGNGTCCFGGDGGPAIGAQFNLRLGGLSADRSGNILIADSSNNRIRKVDAATGTIQTVAGSGFGSCGGCFGLTGGFSG